MQLILVLSFLVLYINLWMIIKKTKIADGKTLLAFPYAITIFFAYLFGITELLSLFEGITFFSLTVSWWVFIAINGLSLVLMIKKCGFGKRDMLPAIDRIKSEKYPLGIFALFSIMVLMLAYHTAPYNLDSMAVYLPKVMHWAQNQSVKQYAALYMAQNTTPDFAQYIQLHVFILSGYTDRFLTLIQCISYITDAVLVFLIAKKLGCKREWSYVAAGIFLSLPIAFSEAMNTQYDLITAVFALALIIMLLHYYEDSSRITLNSKGVIHNILMGGCVGLALIAKSTTVFIIAVFILGLFIICYKQKIGWKTFLVSLFASAASAVIFFIPKAIRMYQTFGTIFAKEFSSGQIVETLDPRLLFLCFIKNLSFNFSGHYIYMSGTLVEKGMALLAKILHVDLCDARISLYDFFTLNEPFDYNHDRATGELICILTCVAVVIGLIALFRKKYDKIARAYAVASIISFVLFITLMKFTTHRTRYEICYFALLCPAVCIIFQRHIKDKVQIGIRSCVLFLAICEIVNLFIFHANIVVESNGGERPAGYFRHQQYTYASYIHTTEFIKNNNYKSIGLINSSWFEYQIWAMTKGYVEKIECVNIDNETAVYEQEDFLPDCILYMGRDEMEGINTISCHGVDYIIEDKIFDEGYIWFIVARKP